MTCNALARDAGVPYQATDYQPKAGPKPCPKMDQNMARTTANPRPGQEPEGGKHKGYDQAGRSIRASHPASALTMCQDRNVSGGVGGRNAMLTEAPELPEPQTHTNDLFTRQTVG